MPAVSQLSTRILWSWIIVVTAVVLETSAKAPVRAESPGIVAADNRTSLQTSVTNETKPRSLQLGLLPYLSPEALIVTHRPPYTIKSIIGLAVQPDLVFRATREH